jgi:WD40 repeat protein
MRAGGQPLATLEGNTDIVGSPVFSPDDQRIVIASADGTVVSGNYAFRDR